MEIPLQIVVRNISHSDALEARVRDGVRKLEEFHYRITGCRVTIEEFGKHRSKGQQFQVRIDLRIPGKEIIVDCDHDMDVYVALRDALNAARRQLEEAARVMRGDVKGHEPARNESGEV
jgi:ribosome-associated translation inhibitor RaiA